MREKRLCVLLLSVLALCVGPGDAAAEITATVSGVVAAVDGARLPGVALRVIEVESGASVHAVSSDAGLFRIAGLAPGEYELRAELAGFEPRRIAGIVLRAGESLSLVVRLDIASLHETVRVVGAVPPDSIEALEMRESRARDVGEALDVVPGVAKVRKGAIAADVVLRGLQGKDVTVLIDGQRVEGACPGHMDPPAFHVDFAEVTRVELSRGPFDVKNQGALGGVLNVVTERPQRGWHGSAAAALASARAFSLSGSASIGAAGWAALAGASARRADAYRDGRGARITDSAGYRPDVIDETPAYSIWTAWGRLALVPRAATTLQVSYTRQAAGAMVYPYLQMDALFDNADRAGIRLETTGIPGGWDALAAHAYYTRVDHWMTDELRTSAMGTRAYSMGTRARNAVAGGRAEIQRDDLSIGFEASRRNWNTSTMLAMRRYEPQAAVPDVTIDVVGGFATYAIDLGERWRLDTGGRLDRADSRADPQLAHTALYRAYHETAATHANDLLPAAFVRATWRHEDGWSATASAGHSSRLPDQQERFYGLRRAGSDWVGNPALEPSHNTGVEGEVRGARHGVEARVTAFLYRLDDFIRVVERERRATIPGVANARARTYANVDASMRGFEATVIVPLRRALFLSAAVSMVRGTQRGRTGDLPEMPPGRARLRLRYDTARWNASAELAGSARQTKVAGDLREAPTAASAVINLRAGFRAGALTITAAMDNALDATYAEHLSYQRDPFRTGVRVNEPGRTLSFGVAARF